ncbi:hypothetical protein AYJ66_04360 [Dietzia cinnamea]|nr:hypothetical protein AYJ66_04360 [Dietzia cinnamea]
MSDGWSSASLKDARRSLAKEIYDVVEVLVKDEGWRLRVQGHKYALYCPCTHDRANFITIPGTPKNAKDAARRIKRSAAKCPDRHALMK